MTEKVVSLSGGLVPGMVVALFLGIGATLTETTDPVFETTASTSPAEPKEWDITTTPKINSPLHRTNLQHTYIASSYTLQ